MSKQKSGFWPILVINPRKARAIRRACGTLVVTLMSNQNGKTVYNRRLGSELGLTLKEVQLIQSILPTKSAKRRLARQAKRDAKKGMPKYSNPPKPPKKTMANQPKVDNTTKPPK
jgi:hypothetical protein